MARTLLDIAEVLSARELGRALEQTEVLRLFDLRDLDAVGAPRTGTAARVACAARSEPWTRRRS